MVLGDLRYKKEVEVGYFPKAGKWFWVYEGLLEDAPEYLLGCQIEAIHSQHNGYVEIEIDPNEYAALKEESEREPFYGLDTKEADEEWKQSLSEF